MSSTSDFLTYLGQTSPEPLQLEIDRAEGIELFGPGGKKYYDLISGISVANIGHRHPKVVQAIKDQADKYLHVMAYGEYIQSPVTNFAKNLVSLLPDSLNNVYFVNSGTEAVEAAIKLAKRHTGRTEIVSFDRSYHGNTHGSLSVSGNEIKKNAFRPLLPDITFIRFNHPEDLKIISSKTAAVIVEPIQGDAGVILPKHEFLSLLAKKCKSTGTLLIFDEVQTGFGRTGKMFAFEHFNTVPQILCLAKALGGGLPLGALISSKQIMDDFTHSPMLGHITTFGGNPVACAAGNATLEVLTSGVLDTVEEKGQLFEALLTHPKMKDFRRSGLMMAIEFENDKIVSEIIHRGIEMGVITYFFLSNRNSFRLAPPLTITFEEIRKVCAILQEVFSKVL